MSATILGGDFTVYFTNDTSGDGDLQIIWTGSATGTRTVNELYSNLQDLFDNNTAGVGDYMNEGIPMSASTPTQYTIGEIETNDNEPWFIDPETVNHLTGGALETTGWTRSFGGSGDIGIVRFDYTVGGGTDFASSDIGLTVTHSVGGDSGKLLYFTSDGSSGTAYVRPDSNGTADDWDSTGTNVSVTSGTGTGLNQTAAATSGELVWTNLFTIGNIVANTRLYVYQEFSNIPNFWGDGHLDRLFITSDGFNAAPGLIDDGLLTVFARQYGKFYDHSIVNAQNGGRIPVALSASDDTNNATGYRTMTVAGSSGTWTVDNYIYKSTGGLTWTTTDTKGVITAVSGNDITYYLIGDLTDFVVGTDDVQEYTGTANGDASATSISTIVDAGPAALSTDPTFVFGAGTNEDIGQGGPQPYDVHIDVQGNTLSDFYEFTKYATRRGADEPLLTDYGHEGEQYTTVGELRIPYDGQTANFTQGAILTGQTSGATAVIVADHDGGTSGTLIVRDVRGTFDDTTPEEIRDDSIPGIANIVSGGLENTLISRVAPFGTFAGGQFFGARGVWIENMHANDANSYTLIDSNGVTRTPPTTFPISITVTDAGTTAIESAQVFVRKSDSYYDYTSHNTNNAEGGATFEVNETVDTDLPQTGWLHVWDSSTNTKQDYRYASWTGLVFTLLAEVTGSATSTDGTDPDIKLISTSTNFLTADIEEGDTIRNTTTGAWAIVDEIVDADNITTSTLSSGQWTSGDTFSFHRLAVTYNNTDLVDVPIFNGQTNAGGIASSTYAGSVPISIVVRIRSNEGSPKYIPFNTSGTIGTSGFSLTAVLIEDTVAT